MFKHSFRLIFFLVLTFIATPIVKAASPVPAVIGGVSYYVCSEGYGDNAVATYAYVSGPAADFAGIVNIEPQVTAIYKYTKTDEFGNPITDNQGNVLVVTRSLTAPVTTITNNAFKNKSVVSVAIPNSITTINDYAFSGCTGLTSVNIPNSVTAIGNSVFSGCTGLTSVGIHSSFIGNNMFSGCTGLTSVNISNSVTAIGNSAFYGCTGLSSVNIPNSVTAIGNFAFYGCTGLTSVNIPISVTAIGNYAYSGCTALTSATIPNSVTEIGERAFSSCRSLTTVTVPSSVITLGHDAFNHAGLKYASVDSKNIGSSAFYHCDSLETLIIGNSVNMIEESAFSFCDNLRKIHMGNSIDTIGLNAFYGSRNVAEVHITDLNAWYKISYYDYKSTPFGSTSYDKSDGLFLNGNLIKEIIIPDTMTHINKCVFCGVNLSSLIIPASVTSIGNDAFWHCFYKNNENSQPTSITCYAEVPPATGNDVFEGSVSSTTCQYTVLHVPKGTIEAYKTANTWRKFRNIEEIESDFTYGDVDGDGKIGISDVTSLIDLLLNLNTTANLAADVDGDGNVSISDVTALIDMLLQGR